jgi:hypothetical protein
MSRDLHTHADVDSGSLLIIDPCYLKKEGIQGDINKAFAPVKRGFAQGITVRVGHDGQYKVRIKRRNGRPYKIIIECPYSD